MRGIESAKRLLLDLFDRSRAKDSTGTMGGVQKDLNNP